MEKRDSFVFYTSWLTGIEGYSKQEQAEIVFALIRYCAFGEEPDLSKAHIRMAYMYAKPVIDKNNSIWLRNKRNSKNAGAPLGNQNAVKQLDNNQKSIEGQSKDNPKTIENQSVAELNNQSKNNPYVDVDVDEDVDTDRRINPSSSDSNDSDDAVAVSKKEKAEETKRAMTLIDYYNARIVQNGSKLRSCQSLSPKRKGMVLARLREYGEEKLRLVIDKAVASDFLNYTKKGGPADIEWIMGPENFGKILEGKFDNGNYSRSQAEGDPKNVNSKWGV